jgi:hypothetical protein
MTPSNTPKKAREFFIRKIKSEWHDSYIAWDEMKRHHKVEDFIHVREVLTPEVDPRAAGVEWVMENVFKYGGSCGLDHATAIKREAIREGILK